MDKRFLGDCLARGMSLDEIAGAAGRHPSSVVYWIGRHGLIPVWGRPKSVGIAREELEPFVAEGLTIEGIARRLGIGDTTVRHWLRRHGLMTVGAARRVALAEARRTGKKRVQVECKRHGLVEHVAVDSESRLRCIKCRAEAVSRRRRKVKEILVAEAGGQCVMCGYHRHSAGLQFHHINPATKSFGLGVRGITRSIAKLREEARKCVLLCATCHAEIEAGASELPVQFEQATG